MKFYFGGTVILFTVALQMVCFCALQ